MQDHSERQFSINKQHVLAMVISVASILLVVSPLLREGIYATTDAPYHLARIEGIFLNLLEGVFPAKIHISAAYTYGYGTGFFYPDLFLYIPACLMLAGASLEMSWKVFLLLIVVVSFLSMAMAIRILCRGTSPIVVAVGGALYITCGQYVTYLYGSQSVGSACAMMCAPLAIAELLRICWRTHNRWDLLRFTLATCGVVLSHLSTAIIMLVFMALICLCSVRGIKRDLRILAELLACMFCGMILTIAFWGPMLEQLAVQAYGFQTELIKPISGTNETWATASDTFGYAILIVLMASTIQWVVNLCSKRSEGVLFAALVPSVMLAILTYCPVFWDHAGQWLDWLQFPSRLLNPVMAAVVLAGAYIVTDVNGEETVKKVPRVLMLVLLMAVSIWQFSDRIGGYSDPMHLQAGLITEQIAGLGAGEEWLPSDADRYGLNEPNKSYDPDGNGADGSKHDYGKYYDVYVYLNQGYYDVPYLYYKGYAAYLLDDNGNPLEELQVVKSDRLAYVRVLMPEGREGIGHIMVTYRKTMAQKVCYVVNVAAIAALFMGIVWTMKDSRQSLRKDHL